MSFTAESIIFAVPATSLANVAQARETYGEHLPFRPVDTNSETVKTLLGHRDREGSDDLRAGVLGMTVTGTALTDGSIAFRGHFVQAFVEALGVDPLLAGCRILTEAEFSNLLPKES
jgi:hypothetical protein